jgi:hypothetical protein
MSTSRDDYRPDEEQPTLGGYVKTGQSLLPARPPVQAAPSATPAQGLADLVARIKPSIVLVVAE